ncbi:MAG TPA: SPFH domain-containing protein [Treponemataceae bacterium]|nr:SPFH domain-containing protein [Treponemataceae bacterium]
MKDDSSIIEKKAPCLNGMLMFCFNMVLITLCVIGMIYYGIRLEGGRDTLFSGIMLAVSIFVISTAVPLIQAGLKILRPNEALVLTLFGSYYGTLKGSGIFFVNPFAQAVYPLHDGASSGCISDDSKNSPKSSSSQTASAKKKISLKAMTLNNDKQKVNDALGNPIVVGIVVVWKVTNTAKALFNVDNFVEFLSIQCDSALRNIVRLYPYDSSDEDGEKSLRGSSLEVADKLKDEIQQKVEIAGLDILEAKITHLSYAPEIAPVMLQRQQAVAVVAARQYIVDSAVGMVEMALEKLSEKNIVNLDEERKAAMVSNLMVVLCANKETQPIVNAGSLY